MPLSSIIIFVCAFLMSILSQTHLANQCCDEGVKNSFSKTNQPVIAFHKKIIGDHRSLSNK